jgi:sugar/nucleoside kinase (ribokinase family)
MSSDNQVLVVGTVALDDVETPFGKKENALGGSAVYFSWANSFFSSVSMVGVIGEDFPNQHLNLLDQRGIDIQALKKINGKTFHWEGKYEYDLNTAHTLKTDLNVLADFDPELLPYQRDIKYLFLANIDPVLQLKVAKEMNEPKVIATDTMNYWIESKREDLLKVLKITDYLLVNDAEARQLGEESNLIAACRKILSWGPKVIIVKQGEYGVTMFYHDDSKEKIQVFAAPSIPLETVIDPTGAGDSFAGAFMGYLASQKKINEKTIRSAVAMGSVVASFTVEGFSLDALKEVEMEDIKKRFRSLRNIAYFEDIDLVTQ